MEELDVSFGAPGDPVKNEKKMPHNILLAERRRILGLDDEGVDEKSDGSVEAVRVDGNKKIDFA